MPKYIAFLRAINVGGHTVTMDQLRGLFEGLRFSNVTTFIASGNVIFDSKSTDVSALETKIENCLRKELGYEVATFLRSTSELASVANYQPFETGQAGTEGGVLYVGFLSGVPSKEAREKISLLRTELDDLHVFEREIYWLCRTRMSDSKVTGARLEKALGVKVTFRNVNTVKKLASKHPSE